MRVLDLFSGIGGFSLGLERAGMETVAFCEIDPYCQRVLRKHWPYVPIFDDITAENEWPAAEVVCGGFPCQDISVAGRGAGLAGERSGLWRDMARTIGMVKPRWIVVENVAALLSRGLEHVLGDLAALGYDAEWHCIPASAVGAPHRRDRIWIVAHAPCIVFDGGGGTGPGGWREFANGDWWSIEPDVGRVAHGVPARVDRLRALGNAVVPQIPELIGRAIMEADGGRGDDAGAI